MTAAPSSTPSLVSHTRALFALSLTLLLALVLSAFVPHTEVLLPYLIFVVGALAGAVLARVGRKKRAAARERLKSSASGRIVEHAEADERIVFELPGAALEPWTQDARVLWTASLVLLWLALSVDALARPLAAILLLVLIAMSLRLLSASFDSVRLELVRGGWRAEGVEGARVIRRAGLGALRAELLPESLVLWSKAGRVGVVRAELEPEERAWLALRLERAAKEAAARSASSFAEPSSSVDDAPASAHEIPKSTELAPALAPEPSEPLKASASAPTPAAPPHSAPTDPLTANIPPSHPRPDPQTANINPIPTRPKP